MAIIKPVVVNTPDLPGPYQNSHKNVNGHHKTDEFYGYLNVVRGMLLVWGIILWLFYGHFSVVRGIFLVRVIY